MASRRRVRFENAFARQLYIEASGIQDIRELIKGSFVSQEDMWEIWQKVYKENYGCTRYILTEY